LGCGGLLALLVAAGQPAHVVVMTDGAMVEIGSVKEGMPARVSRR